MNGFFDITSEAILNNLTRNGVRVALITSSPSASLSSSEISDLGDAAETVDADRFEVKKSGDFGEDEIVNSGTINFGELSIGVLEGAVCHSVSDPQFAAFAEIQTVADREIAVNDNEVIIPPESLVISIGGDT